MVNQQLYRNEEVIKHKLSIYTFLQKFYAGQLIQLSESDWRELIGLIKIEWMSFSQDDSQNVFNRFYDISEEDVEELEYEFNRLFVGPNRLEASPYESTYRNDQRSLMQYETLAVRKFYQKAGLEVSKKNVDPDDHLALELEFVCYLLKNSIENDQYYKLYQDFLEEHLLQWIVTHCGLVREKTNNQILVGISYLLQHLLSEEKNQLSLKGGK
ncbi:MAG: molecular chaperone [Anaerobacillus sp.]|uniref:TorD/DmsD family molecular chaperone n=1 Tax=Anaerobacillus sp. TaxID=1872506 RepID=UPI00391AC7EF